jgi:hypothetical protein
MFRKMALAPGLMMAALALQTAVAAEPLPPASQWIPQDAIAVLELSRPKDVLDVAFQPEVAAAVTSSPAYRKQADQPGLKQFLAVIAYLEARLGTDWRTGVQKLVGGGVTLAISADGAVLMIVDAEDGELLERLHEILLGFAKDEAAKQGEPDRVASREYRGVTGWTFGKDEAHVIVGKRLMVANRPEALEAALDRRAEPDGPRLASLPAYQAAKTAAGADAAATAFVNLAVLKGHPPVQQALTPSENPLAALLFAGVAQSLRGSDWLALGLRVDGDTLALNAVADGKAPEASGPAAFAEPGQPDEGVLPILSVPRRIAGLTLYRDLHAFYAAKDDLFPERTSGLIFFENMMGIFFSGLDLTEEVLAETRPEIRFIVAEQEYDPAVGTPRVQFPAFAAIFRLRHPEQFTEVVEEAWQKAVGLVNFTRGQQASPGLIIDRPSHAGTKFTVAYFRAPKDGDRTNIESRFNFRPALATVGNYLILSSTEGLTGDLIDALKKETTQPAKPLADVHSLVQVDGAQLASILGANRENLIRQNMVNEGNTREQAETGVDLLMTVLRHVGQVKLNVGRRAGRPQASLELGLNWP